MPENRRSLPDPVKRILRQEAGFGCCKCGRPVIEYHHIAPYTSTDPHFRPQDMMCLCPYCHHEADTAMDEAEQRYWKEHPINIQNGHVDGLLKVRQKQVILDTGSVQLIGHEGIVRIDGIDMVRFGLDEEGHVLLSVRLFDSQNQLLLEIDNNEWVTGSALPWDIEASFQSLVIRERRGVISLDVRTDGKIIWLNGVFWHNRAQVQLRPSGISYRGIGINGGTRNLCMVCSFIRIETLLNAVYWSPYPDPGWGCIISEANMEERIRQGLQAYDEIISGSLGPSHFKSIVPPLLPISLEC